MPRWDTLKHENSEPSYFYISIALSGAQGKLRGGLPVYRWA